MTLTLQAFKNYFREHPLRSLLFLGLFFRLAAVIFSKGYGWHDDHFLVMEAAQSWVDGTDYNNWLPSASDPSRAPQGHSFFYVGMHYVILKSITACGLTDPQGKMYIIRLLHALWSLLIIYFGFKIAYKRAGLKVATWVGAMLSLYWCMPFLSVRNLVEFACIPPLVMATWYALKEDKMTSKAALLCGIMLGIGFSIRFQTIMFSAGFGLALLLQRTAFRQLLLVFLGFVLTACLTQGTVDYFIWGKPFSEFLAYVQYNIDNATVYGTNVYHMYFSLLLGMLIPPLSILLFAGYFKKWKVEPVLFWPSLLFLLFHTYFPNKQERFILPIMPFIIILGCMGGAEIIARYHWETKKWFRGLMWFCVILNFLLLPALTVSYSKRNRVEAMCYIAEKKDVRTVIIEDSNRDDFLMPPLYYLGKWGHVIGVTSIHPADSARAEYDRMKPYEKSNYIVFMQAEHIEARVDSMKKYFPTMEYEATIEPSFIDKTMFWLNPVNDNQTTYVYKIK